MLNRDQAIRLLSLPHIDEDIRLDEDIRRTLRGIVSQFLPNDRVRVKIAHQNLGEGTITRPAGPHLAGLYYLQMSDGTSASYRWDHLEFLEHPLSNYQ